MLMPEATIDEYHRMIFRQNNIGASRQFSYIFAVTKPLREQILSDNFFGLGILTANMRHVFASYFF